MAGKKASRGKQCASMDCFSYEYTIVDGHRVNSGIKFYSFPLNDKGKLLHWCNLIKRKNNTDRFAVNKHAKICEKHFEKHLIYRAPGGTRTRLLEDAKPVLHPWNDFSLAINARKAPASRPPPRKKCCIAPTPELNEPTDFVIQPTEIAMENQDTSIDSLEVKVKELTELLRIKEQQYQSLSLQIHNTDLSIISHIKSNDTVCNHYTGFRSLNMLMSVFTFLDTGADGEKVILYNNQEKMENEGRGRKRSLSPLHRFYFNIDKITQKFRCNSFIFSF